MLDSGFSYAIGDYKEADIGWRDCRDELPSEDGRYRVRVEIGGSVEWMEFKNGIFLYFSMLHPDMWHKDAPVPECKLPEPLPEKDLPDSFKVAHAEFVDMTGPMKQPKKGDLKEAELHLYGDFMTGRYTMRELYQIMKSIEEEEQHND